MNIFAIDLNPYEAAKNLCDCHVIKMILESCQLLSTHDRLNGLEGDRYKQTHKNHPCRVCLNNENNYKWLQHHLHGLLNEYTYRFGKIHKSQALFEKYWKVDESMNELDLNKISLPQCMPDEFKNKLTIDAYKNYYKFKKETIKRWKYTNRNEPDWLMK